MPEIQALWATHEAAQKTVAADRDKKLANLDYIYRLNVDKLKNERAAVGDLDGALAAKAELDRLSAHQALTDAQRKAMNPELGKLRAAYEAALKGYQNEEVRSEAALLQKLLADLEALQTRITTTGDLDKALVVKAQKERIAAEAQGRPVANTPLTPAPVPEPPKVQPSVTLPNVTPNDSERGWIRLFRSNDPKIWNTDTNVSEERFAISLANAPNDAKWFRMKRPDLGGNDCVIIPISFRSLTGGAGTRDYHWTGTGKKMNGHTLLGISRLGAIARDGDAKAVSISPGHPGWGWGISPPGVPNPGPAFAWNCTKQGESKVVDISVKTTGLTGEESKHVLK